MIIKIVATAAIAAVLSLILKQYRPEYSVVLQVCAGAGIITVILLNYSSVIEGVKSLFSSAAVGGDSFKAVWKVLGVSLLTRFASDLCRDSGETALAGNVETAGKWIILLYSLPFMKIIINFSVELMKDI